MTYLQEFTQVLKEVYGDVLHDANRQAYGRFVVPLLSRTVLDDDGMPIIRQTDLKGDR